MIFALKYSAISYALHFVGTWYSWGGNDPEGFDCSGFIVEILQSVGKIDRDSDYTAAQLYELFPETDKPKAGVLAFWKNKKGDIIHVELCLNKWQTIGASGGDRRTLTKEDAIKNNAFIKKRPIREGAIYADPFTF